MEIKLVNRRNALLALAALWAAAARALAQAQKRPRIGYLIASTGPDFPALHGALRRGLSELGYVDGQNVEILVRSADGSADRYPALVAELARQDVDVIFTANTPAAIAAATGAPNTPVVFAGVGDPVGSKLVTSLSHPGGNATGLVLLTPQLTPKRLELLKEAVPRMARVSVLWNSGIAGHREELKNLEDLSRRRAIRLHPVAVQRAEELEAAFSSMGSDQADGLMVLASPLHHRHIRQIADLALKHRLAAICEFSEFVGAGGLMVYGPSWPEMYRQGAVYVAKILKGAKPAELPVEQPRKIELVVNMATAKALGVRLPPSVLLRAERVIE